MKYPTLVILIVGIAAIVAAGCTATSPANPQNVTATIPATVTVAIQPDITRYTMLMSSAPGIGLSPTITGLVPAGNLTTVWTTDYGHFLIWQAPDYTVQDAGSSVTTNGTKVYWTYPGTNAGVSRPPVHITLTVIDAATNTTLGQAEQTIGWGANDTAVIG